MNIAANLAPAALRRRGRRHPAGVPRPPYALIEQPGAEAMEEIFRLRGHAWRSRMPDFAAPERWEDPEDAASLHWAIAHGGRIVAAARLTIAASLDAVPSAEVYAGVLPARGGPIASINRLVVDPDHAGCGLSQWLDRVRLARADTAGAAQVVAQTFAGGARISALAALGFVVIGEAAAYRSGPLAALDRRGAASNTILVLNRAATGRAA